jgi:2-polyprenyl-3-methyl-5-hydroxy-6-metoxy-1,4-benzoquinol methylase
MSENEMDCWLCGSAASIDETYRTIPFYRCSSCGFLFAPQRDIEELHDLYDDTYFTEYPGGEAYEADEQQRRHEASLRRDWIEQHVTGGRLLEVGATSGAFMVEMQEHGFEVVGVEPAPGPAEIAREQRGLDVRTGFIEDVELPEEKFDVVCAWHVLEHITKPQGSMKRLREATNDDGWLFLEIPNIMSINAKREKTNWFNLDPAHHVAFYDPAQLRTLLDDAGFKLLETTSISGFSYMRAGRRLAPKELAAQALETVQTRTVPGRLHPWKHDLLRAVARAA